MDLVYLATLAILVGATFGLAIVCDRLQPHRGKRP
jgi:hypothetical protein